MVKISINVKKIVKKWWQGENEAILHSQSFHTEIASAISYWYTLWQIMNVTIHGHRND